MLTVIHNQCIGSLHGQKRKQHGHSRILKMSINRESLILGVASCSIQGVCVLWLVPIIGVLGSFIVNMVTIDVATPKNECQQSVNNFGCGIWYNPRAKLWLLCIIEVLAACIGNVDNVVVTTRKDERQQCVKTASTESQQSINRASTEHQQSINRASTIVGVASCIIQGRCYYVYP